MDRWPIQPNPLTTLPPSLHCLPCDFSLVDSIRHFGISIFTFCNDAEYQLEAVAVSPFPLWIRLKHVSVAASSGLQSLWLRFVACHCECRTCRCSSSCCQSSDLLCDKHSSDAAYILYLACTWTFAKPTCTVLCSTVENLSNLPYCTTQCKSARVYLQCFQRSACNRNWKWKGKRKSSHSPAVCTCVNFRYLCCGIVLRTSICSIYRLFV